MSGSRVLICACTTVGAALLGATPWAAASSGTASAAPRPIAFATAPSGASKPDDITTLGKLLYVTYQNNAGKDGSPAGSRSTVVAFTGAGRVAARYSILGRVDGLSADPAHNRIFATANEDLNSSLYVIRPGVTVASHYSYSPDPGLVGGKSVNGGTDAVSIGAGGTIYVAHSNPDPSLPDPPAVYTLTLSGSTAHLSPLYGVNDAARSINHPRHAPSPLRLTDPDSNRIIAGAAGSVLIQDAQADSKLVFASNLHASRPTLQQLSLTNAAATTSGKAATPQLDDIVQVTGPGTLYAVDQGTGTIYAIDTRTTTPGTLFVSQPRPSTADLPNDPALGTLDAATGVVTHIDTTLTSPKGLLFIPAANHASNLATTGPPDAGVLAVLGASSIAAGIVLMTLNRRQRRRSS